MPDKTGSDHVEGSTPKPRRRAGQFVKGESGNPAGRPRGARDRRTVLLAELLDDSGKVIVKKLIDQARAGDPWAVRLCVERLLPKMERRLEIELPLVQTAADVGIAVGRVISLAADGSLTTEEARAFLSLLEQQRKAIETNDLAVRLDLLESAKKEDF